MKSSSSPALRLVPSAVPEPTDAELVAGALRADPAAQEALFRRHAPGVTQMAERMLRDAIEAEDVVQHTFEAAFRKLHRLESPGSLRSWLLSIAVRRCHRVFRRQRLRRALGIEVHPEPETLMEQVGSRADAETRAELALLDTALAQMKGPDRAAWLLRRVEGATLPECATACGCSLATVKRRIARAEKVVQQHIVQGRSEQAPPGGTDDR